MASKIKVLDLGSYSVKVVTLTRSMVGTGVASLEEHILASRADGKGRDRETGKILKELNDGRKRLVGDGVAVGYPAERILNRKLEMPFSDRSKIDRILPFELEQYVPFPADEIVADYLLRRSLTRKNGAEIFSGIIQEQHMVELMGVLDGAGMEPRVVTHPLVSMARLPLPPSQANELSLLVDLGHTKTLALILQGGWITAHRCIMRAGMALTRRLADELQISFEDAEQLKHEAHLFPAGQDQLDGEGRPHEIAKILRDSLGSVARDLLAMIRSMSPDASVNVYLMGGTARLKGITEFFASKLSTHVEVLEPSSFKVASAAELEGPVVVPGLAIGLDSVKGSDSSRLNFRRLRFPYAGDFRYLRGRLVYFSIMSVLLAGTFVSPSILKYRALEAENERILTEITNLSQEILGEPLSDPDEVAEALAAIPKPDVWTVFPDMTALEAFYEVEDVVAKIDGLPMEGVFKEVKAPEPPAETGEGEPAEAEGEPAAPPAPAEPEQETHGLVMTFISVDMSGRTRGQSGVIEFRGDGKSVSTLELFETELGKHPCFHKIIRSSQEVVASTAERKGWQRFGLTFNVYCPKNEDRAKNRKSDEQKDEMGEEFGVKPAPGSKDKGAAPAAGQSGAEALGKDLKKEASAGEDKAERAVRERPEKKTEAAEPEESAQPAPEAAKPGAAPRVRVDALRKDGEVDGAGGVKRNIPPIKTGK